MRRQFGQSDRYVARRKRIFKTSEYRGNLYTRMHPLMTSPETIFFVPRAQSAEANVLKCIPYPFYISSRYLVLERDFMKVYFLRWICMTVWSRSSKYSPYNHNDIKAISEQENTFECLLKLKKTWFQIFYVKTSDKFKFIQLLLFYWHI